MSRFLVLRRTCARYQPSQSRLTLTHVQLEHQAYDEESVDVVQSLGQVLVLGIDVHQVKLGGEPPAVDTVLRAVIPTISPVCVKVEEIVLFALQQITRHVGDSVGPFAGEIR